MYTLEDGGRGVVVEAVHSFDTLKQPKQAKLSGRPKKAYNFGLGRAAKMYRPE